ncbi:TPA: hypothetical protein ACKP0F_000208 [Stenotrophomonas maltophilia]|uniref:hypothetical protein n=1 Tax=Stenotrophomonas maltophilia TaxID=40324 RepID=UPI002264C611|nr:hypothetical protein [Stenotrophomonas maltophilia]
MAATDFTYFASSTVRIAHISAISDVIDNGPEAGSRRYQVNIIVSGITLSEAYSFEPGALQARSEIMDAMEG